MQRQRALVTGASAGIGRALAAEFARHGHDVAVVARRRDKLEALAEELTEAYAVDVAVIPQDLSGDDAPETLLGEVEARGLTVDILVNNAGIVAQGAFTDTPLDRITDLVHLNMHTPAQLARRVLPGMLERGGGRILNVASIAAFQAVPSFAVYAASKAFVLSLTESVAEELRGTGVTVTALCPGFTRTEMYDEIAGQRSWAEWVPAFLLDTPESVARAGYRACARGDAVCVPGLPNRMATELYRLPPRGVQRRLSGLLGRRLL